MKISCQSCGAKYNIADEKVRGKIVKIACKKCGARIEIDGREPAEQASDQDETRVYDQAGAPGAPGADVWTVSVDDNDQREVNTAQLIDLYAQGTINADTYVWREGMADWQTIREVDALRDRLPAQMPSGPPAAAMSYPQQQQQPAMQQQPMAYAPSNGGMAAGAPMAAAPSYPQPQIETAAQARLGGSRRGGGVDLFGGAQGQTEDEDVATSAPTAGAALAASMGGEAVDQRPIGARNENSVLFSLAALTASGPAQPAANVADDEKSGLIDIQKLAAAAKNDKTGDRAKLDDIMNLGGGGAFGSALGAPILAPPPTAALEAPPEEKKKSNALLFALIGMGAVIVVLLVVLLTRGSKDETASKDKDKDKGLSAPTTSATTAAPTYTTTATAAPTDTAPPDTTASGPIGSKTPGKNPPSGAGVTGKSPPTTDTGTKDNKDTKPPPADTSTGGGSKPCKTLEECMGAGKAPPPPPTKDTGTSSGGGGPEFDKGAARSALSSVPYKDCGSGGGGSVTVTFAPSGSAVSASVSGDYDGGTKSCIASRFKAAKVPAFGGPSKTVSWKISL